MILLDLERVVPLRGRENGVSAESVVWMAVGYGMACTVSRAVQALICVAVMGEHSKVSKRNIVSPGMGTSVWGLQAANSGTLGGVHTTAKTTATVTSRFAVHTSRFVPSPSP